MSKFLETSYKVWIMNKYKIQTALEVKILNNYQKTCNDWTPRIKNLHGEFYQVERRTNTDSSQVLPNN